MLRRFSSSLRVKPAIRVTQNLCRRELVVGNVGNGVQPSVNINWTDIVGVDTTIMSRLAAGELLAMLDLCAKRVAELFLSSKQGGVNTSTVGVTNTIFSSPVLHGDVIRMHGRLVFCGASSMGIHIDMFRRSPSTLMESPIGESFFTMVAIDDKLNALKVVPAVDLTDGRDVALHDRYMNIRQETRREEQERAARVASKVPLHYEELEGGSNKAKVSHVPIASTRTTAHRIFLLYHLNHNRTIFGGELMRWMEKHAVHCGRMFTGNRHVYTVGMHGVAFHQPVLGTDWVTLEADVIYVRNTTMEVDVKLTAERAGRIVVTNRASFVLVNTDELGQKSIIAKGLDLKSASREHLLRFAEAKERYTRMLEFSRNALIQKYNKGN